MERPVLPFRGRFNGNLAAQPRHDTVSEEGVPANPSAARSGHGRAREVLILTHAQASGVRKN